MTKEQDERIHSLIQELISLITEDPDSVAVLGVFTSHPTDPGMMQKRRFIHGSSIKVGNAIGILADEFEQLCDEEE